MGKSQLRANTTTPQITKTEIRKIIRFSRRRENLRHELRKCLNVGSQQTNR